jgi:hypothetical protein
MRGWDFFYFSRRSRKQRSMAVAAHLPECEVAYSLLAEEFAEEASLAMVCDEATPALPRSYVLAGRLRRFRMLMKKSTEKCAPSTSVQVA